MSEAPEPLAGLIREHRLIEETVAATLLRVRAANTTPDDADVVGAAVEQLWLLQLLLERDVALHIEKEEQVLFPALRQAAAGLTRLVDHMIDEHDEIKARRDGLGQALTTLDAEHEEVLRLQASVELAAARVRHGDIISNLQNLAGLIERLDWVFQGHFTGEEDGLFLPAEDLLSADTFATMAERMAALAAARS
ncbi:MAG: hemerythrin domain-containing protein [Dehalococcoidia bacterium]